MVLVYVTLNTLEEGQRLAELLMARQLTNCVNFHPITCTYLWEGKITTEPEVVALIKTQAEHFDAIAPGITDTAQPRYGMSEEELQTAGRQVPLGRMGTPEDVADLAVFLASEEARHITGQTLHVNGGQYLY